MKKKPCSPTCKNCQGGKAVVVALDHDENCVLCGGFFGQHDLDRDKQNGPIIARSRELRGVLSLYLKQLELDDPLRVANLNRMKCIVESMLAMEKGLWPE
jgi:hypothetical protein